MTNASGAPTILAALVDTNVILDAVLSRARVAEAQALLDAVGEQRLAGYVAAHAVTTVHYVARKAVGEAPATQAVHDLLTLLTVVPLDGSDFTRALSLGFGDFEDAVQVAAALRVGADFLVTHNPKDFAHAPAGLQVRSAAEVVAALGL